ncbi:tyrosine-type recombinase/integrase [Collimonas sp.]|jgi:integrase/recombinase XerD|uniref:tyrosine-type recombinase/integrase n=1 Tax=Collimonas sp. TaxID=1963772 RepID=UPI002B7A5773|nr:tyrosine-type recombinase/integrase [Collimonas sp.]HWX03066.1 tyrosine-type recombinase/integrase [Collimonas sp.]
MDHFALIDLEPPDRNVNTPTLSMDLFAGSAEAEPLVAARSDSELARAFLYSSELSENSIKSSKKDLGRFLLWCQHHGKMLYQLHIEDLIAYKAFLKDPQPEEIWVCATKWPRDDPRWRPFSGALSEPSMRQAFRVVKALLEFAKDAGYLRRNAGALVKNVRTARDARITRYLSMQAVAHVHAALDALPATTPAKMKARARDRFLLLGYITTGARLSELTGAAMGAIYTEGDGRWWLDVIGKGAKPRRLPVAPEMLAAFRAYRLAFGLPAPAARNDATPLALSSRGQALVSITDEAASNAMKSLFAAAAILAEAAGDLDDAEALRQASAHWLRHTMLTMHANNEVSLKALQDTAGHANISTTAIYLHKSDKERHDELIGSLSRKR